MNTGIQDALNLGWKLAFAANASDCERLLASYDRERRPVARRVLALTDLAFWFEAGCGPIPSVLRGTLAPLLTPALPMVLRSRRLVSETIRTVSQFRLAYRDSPLSVEGVPRAQGWPRAGEWPGDVPVRVDSGWERLHALLARPGVHVLLDRDAADFDPASAGPYVMVHRLTSRPGVGVVATRPDGYVGFRCGTTDASQLQAWLARIGARVVNSLPV
jgi:hypothetical protein